MKRGVVAAVVAGGLAIAGIGGIALWADAAQGDPVRMLADVGADFDAHAGEVRVLAVLSPT